MGITIGVVVVNNVYMYTHGLGSGEKNGKYSRGKITLLEDSFRQKKYIENLIEGAHMRLLQICLLRKIGLI